MGLQLVDGAITYPIGLLEGVQVIICGIQSEHTDFKQETNYEVILG